MKVINKTKMSVTVCGQTIEKGKNLVVDDKVWKKEWSVNAALQDAVNRNELLVKRDKPSKTKRG